MFKLKRGMVYILFLYFLAILVILTESGDICKYYANKHHQNVRNEEFPGNSKASTTIVIFS